MIDDDPRPPPAMATRRGGMPRLVLPAIILAFLLGAALVGWFAWSGDLDRLVALLPHRSASVATAIPSSGATGTAPLGADQRAERGLAQVAALETRTALLEARLARLDTRADAASGDADHAENLLAAAAIRRSIERGIPLGPLDDQLRRRFGAARPDAVRVLLAFAARPVTLDQLDARLDDLAPALAAAPEALSGWARVRHELANLLVVRSGASPAVSPEILLGRARMMLMTTRTDAAIVIVGHLPGGTAAAGWIDDARRYGAAEQALNAIEASAMSEASPAPAGLTPPSPAT